MKNNKTLIFPVVFIVMLLGTNVVKKANQLPKKYISYNTEVYQCFYNGPLTNEDIGTYLGTIEKKLEDQYSIPKNSLESNFLETGTKIYEWTAESFQYERDYPSAIIYATGETEDGLEVCRLEFNNMDNE
ncbi:MAG: hypothetical protein ACRCZJ_08840 [Erysipelotrichaceae bacterium]